MNITLSEDFLNLLKSAKQFGDSANPDDRLYAGVIYKFLYQQTERIKKWDFIDAKDRQQMQVIMDDLKALIKDL